MYGLKEALRLGNGEGVKHAPHVGPAVWIPYRREHPHLRDMHGERTFGAGAVLARRSGTGAGGDGFFFPLKGFCPLSVIGQ